MKRVWIGLLVCFSLMSTVSAAEKIKVLLVTGGHGFKSNEFFQVFRDNKEIEFTHLDHGKSQSSAYDRPDLLTYDALVLYDMVQQISDEQKSKFKEFLSKGKGLVVMHHALVSYQAWPEFEKIIGGIYPENQTQKGKVTDQLGYEHDVDIPVTIVAKDHPVTAGLKDFTLNDEIYWGFRTTKDAIPLISTTHPKSGKPLAWARTEGKARVVYLQLGHGPTAFANPNYRKLVAQSIRWTSQK